MKTHSRKILLIKPLFLFTLVIFLTSLACMSSAPTSMPPTQTLAVPTNLPTATETSIPTPLPPTHTPTEPLPTATLVPPTVTPTPMVMDFRITDWQKRSFILIMDPSAPNTLYAKSQDAAYMSTDGGTTWTPLNEAELPAPVLNQIFQYDITRQAIDPTSPTTWYAVVGHKFKKSLDAGKTWDEFNQEAWMTGVDALLAVDPSNPQTIFWGIWDGLYRSGDGGLTWKKVIVTPYDDHMYSFFSMILFDPASPNIIYAMDSGYKGLYKSTDGGQSWQSLSGGHFLNQWVVLDPSNPAILYAKDYDRTLYTSADGGSTWEATNLGLPVTDIAYLAIDPANPAIRYAIVNQGDLSGLFKSTDGGQTWTEISTALLP